MAWGQIVNPGMPFKHMMVFTEFSLRTTRNGIRLFNNPIKEIELLHNKSYEWSNISINDANNELKKVDGDLFHIKMKVEILEGTRFQFHKNGNPIVNYTMNHNRLNDVFFAGDNSGSTKTIADLLRPLNY